MANSVWQATIQNAAGDIVPGAEITVIDEGTGLNAVIYSSKGGAALTNPFNADAGGFAQFYSGPGEYRITAFDIGTGLTQTFDNWRLGDSGARDVGTATGQVLLSESAGLNNGETNWTSGNLDPSVQGGVNVRVVALYNSGADLSHGDLVVGSQITLAHCPAGVWINAGVIVTGTWRYVGATFLLTTTQFGEFLRVEGT